jgi:hypothetical protein
MEFVTLFYNECSQIPYGSVLMARTRLAQQIEGLIPSLIDQNRCAQSRRPMVMMCQGWSASLFQAAQQWSRRSV